MEIYVKDMDGRNRRQLMTSSDSIFALAWSPDGTRIAFISNGLYIMDADGGNPRLLLPPIQGTYVQGQSLSWSPDGHEIIFGATNDVRDEFIAIINVHDGSLRRLANPGTSPKTPSWSHDGSHITFASETSIYTIASDGTDLRELIGFDQAEMVLFPTWSPDGEKIIFEVDGGFSFSTYVMNADGTNVTSVGMGIYAYHAWKPKGS
jgi:Tol biopolymer transport system component